MRILVVANEAFSDSGSNSRTMKNMLLNVPRQNLAQFYLHGNPDMDFCTNYFCISDQDALRAFLYLKPVEYEGQSSRKSTAISKRAKNCRNFLIRNVVWQSMRWWTKEFDDFLLDFAPDIVLLQAGDAPFMYAIARKVAKKCNAKLMMYNSEHYVLKDVMYASAKKHSPFHFCLMRSLKAEYRKFMEKVDYCIYSTEALETAYQKKYPHAGKSCALYTTSELEPLTDRSGSEFSLLYCGNLGVGREYSLDELAKALMEVNPNARLDIYGKFVEDEAEALVCGNKNVVFHGFVDYSEIPRLMSEASMLVHCENRDRLENLRYAFSTKIADSLASARPFLVYASRNFPFVEYLETNQCAHIASDPEELKAVLKACMEDRAFLYRHTEEARFTAVNNHSKERNCKKIDQIITEVRDKPEE